MTFMLILQGAVMKSSIFYQTRIVNLKYFDYSAIKYKMIMIAIRERGLHDEGISGR